MPLRRASRILLARIIAFALFAEFYRCAPPPFVENASAGLRRHHFFEDICISAAYERFAALRMPNFGVA